MTINDDLRAAAGQIERGDKAAAKERLIATLKTDPEHQVAWLLLAYAVDDAGQRRECLERVLEIDPTTKAARRALKQLALKQAPPPAPETQASSPAFIERISKRIGVSKRDLLIFAGLVGAALVILATFGTLTGVNQIRHRRALATATAVYRIKERRAVATATAEYITCLADFESEMLKLLSEFFRQENIASTTARINLPEQIARLEDIRNRAWNMESQSCRPRWHSLMMDYMDKAITSYVSFSAEEPDYVWEEKYVESLEALAALDDAVIADGHSGGLVAMFRQHGYYYWEQLDEPDWKENL
jgi:hypothetical protein